MNAMTPRNLAETMGLRLHKLEHAAMKSLILPESLLQMVQGNADRGTLKLHPAVGRGIGRTDQMQAPNKALATDHADLGGKPNRRHGQNGRQPGGKEEGMRRPGHGFVKNGFSLSS